MSFPVVVLEVLLEVALVFGKSIRVEPAQHHFEHHHSYGEDVRFCVVRLALQALGRHVHRGPAVCRDRLLVERRQRDTQAEVGQLQVGVVP